MRLSPVCPDPEVWSLELVTLRRDRIVLHLEPERGVVSCPECGTISRRVHSRYYRTPWDLPWGQWPVQLVVLTRRFFCDRQECPRRIFAEPFPGLLARYARQTERLRGVLLEMAHASSAEMAARLARILGYVTSPDTLIRRQRQEQFAIAPPRVLGMDEFALRRGCTYGTLLVDLERHRPIDVLDGRSAEPVIRWLTAHRGVEVIARDRAEAYAVAGRTAAPAARQVADRFHLVRNVADALKGLVRSRRWTSPEHKPEPANPALGQPASSPKGLVEEEADPQPTPTKRALWEAVQQRKGSGRSMRDIARELGIDRRTVRKYLAADRPPIYSPRPPGRTKLTPYLSYLRERWLQGCHNAHRLYLELIQHGYSGSETQVKVAVRPWRSAQTPMPTRRAPSLRSLILRAHRHLTCSEREDLERILDANPALACGYRLRERFQQLVAQRDVADLPRWIEEAGQCGLPTFEAVARSFSQDYEAVEASLKLPWSTAQCQGQITRVKLLKRLGYGRANVDLLTRRILHRAIA